MRWMLALTLTLMMALPAKAQQAEIENVISSQIQSFLRDDFDTAFTFAAPNIVGIFKTPERFAQMVVNGYPMVYRPADVEFRELEVRAGTLLQRVMLRDQLGNYYVAEYTMVQLGNDWKIAGVSIIRAPGVGA